MSNYPFNRFIDFLGLNEKASGKLRQAGEGMLLQALSNRWSLEGLTLKFKKWAIEQKKPLTPTRLTLALALYFQNTRLVTPGTGASEILAHFKTNVGAALQETPSAKRIMAFCKKMLKAINSPANAAVVAEINAYNPPETQSASSDGGGGAKAPTIPAAANRDETKHGSPPKGGTVVVTVAVPVAAASVKQYSPAEQAERARLIAIIRERNNKKLADLHQRESNLDQKLEGLKLRDAALDQKLTDLHQEDAGLRQEDAQLGLEIAGLRQEKGQLDLELTGHFDDLRQILAHSR